VNAITVALEILLMLSSRSKGSMWLRRAAVSGS
jgi:hypothetical protein